MKKVAIIGANGKSGSALVAEALKQGYDVTGFARNKEYKNGAIKLVHKDVFELSKADLAGFDVVISAIATLDAADLPASRENDAAHRGAAKWHADETFRHRRRGRVIHRRFAQDAPDGYSKLPS